MPSGIQKIINLHKLIFLVSIILFNGYCTDSECPDSTAASSELSSSVLPVTNTARYQPVTSTTWQIQLQGTVNTGYPVDVYDVDLFDISSTQISTLKSSGKKVICYFSAGSYEDWRPDASDFHNNDKGKSLDGWEGENWLDIRSQNVYDIMIARLDLAVSKGCDGVDPDNMDGYTQDSCFAISADDQLAYNKAIANAARSRGLSVGLKNDPDQISQLEGYFDFSITEQCYFYSECSLYQTMILSGKPVFNIEYDSSYVSDSAARSGLCAQSQADNIQTLVMPLGLDDSFRYACF